MFKFTDNGTKMFLSTEKIVYQLVVFNKNFLYTLFVHCTYTN